MPKIEPDFSMIISAEEYEKLMHNKSCVLVRDNEQVLNILPKGCTVKVTKNDLQNPLLARYDYGQFRTLTLMG